MQLEISKDELSILIQSLHDRCKSLDDYTTWIIDHEDLPLRTAAFQIIRKDHNDTKNLISRISNLKD